MSISTAAELKGMQQVSEVVALTLKAMQQYASPGMTTKTLDEFGGSLLQYYGAVSAPKMTYGFPGYTCISVNKQMAHGIPSDKTVLQEGDLINVDVSASLNGFWADNGCSFVVGTDIHRHLPLVNTSKKILQKAIAAISDGVAIAAVGGLIATEAKKAGYTVIRNLTGHGIGRSLHEAPHEIPNYADPFNRQKFRKNSVVAIETFIATTSTKATTLADGWTLVGNRGGFVAQHEHTILITDKQPIVLTASNNIFTS